MKFRSGVAWIILPVIVCSLLRAAVAGASPARIPIEVEVESGAVACAPGDDRFDGGFRSGLRQQQLAVMDTARTSRTIANAFCLASDRPNVKPLVIRVRIRSDGGSIYRPAEGAIGTAGHWLIHIAVPLRANRLAPAPWRRMSLWARSDRENYCESIGHVIALCVLEVLNREAGKIAREELLALGPDVTRDAKYSEGDDWWANLRHDIALATPTVLMWVTLLAIAFVLVRLAQALRQHRGQQKSPPARPV